MKKKPEVSIIIPNYNCEKYIVSALNSVKHQTFPNWECIIIDDGSTDNSVAIIKKYIKNDERFTLIQNKHLGVSVARNSGLDIAKGDYIAFLDADDCYTEYAMEMLLHLAKSTGADMAGATATFVPESFQFIKSNGRVSWGINMTGTTKHPESFILVPRESKWCWVWRRIYKKELIGDTRFHPEYTTFGDDLSFMLDICHKANYIAETKNASVYHRIHESALTNRKFAPNCFDWFPFYFKYIQENLLDKYSTTFWRIFYHASFKYLLHETVIRPKNTNSYTAEARQVLLESCKYIPRKYLNTKQRFLRWFLSCLK